MKPSPASTPGPLLDVVAGVNSHGPLARLAAKVGKAQEGIDNWDQWHHDFRDEKQRYTHRGITTITTTDDNQHAKFDLGGAWTRIGGLGIDNIGLEIPDHGVHVKVGRQERVNLNIDGHDGWARWLGLQFAAGVIETWWVQANLGRHDDDREFLHNAGLLLDAFGDQAVYNFDEIDEADQPNEHADLLKLFTAKRGFQAVGWGTMSPSICGPHLRPVHPHINPGSPGIAHATFNRPIVSALYRPAA